MHVRKDTKRRADGTTRTRASIAHNVRVSDGNGGSVPKPVEILPLGRLEQLDDDMIGAAIAALERFRAQRRAELAAEGKSESPAQEAVALRETVRPRAPLIRLLASRQVGVRMLIEPLWRELGFADLLRAIEKKICRKLPFERIMFAMVLNRLIDPTSKLECVEWVKNRAWFPEAADWDVNDFYAALDVLHRHIEDVLKAVAGAVFERATPEERQILLLDTTTVFTACDVDDDVMAEIDRAWKAHARGEGPKPEDPLPQVVNQPALRKRGHSKDHRKDAPQIVMGIAATGSGEPVWQEIYAGNTSDKSITVDLVEKALAQFPEQRIVVAMDSGMAGRPNLRWLAGLSDKVGWIAGCPVRNNTVVDSVLLGSSSWPTVSKGKGDTWELRTHALPPSEWAHPQRAERLVLIRSRERQRRDLRKLEGEVESVKAILRKDDRAQVDGQPSAAIAKPALRRLVMEKDGRLTLNEAALALEQARCGVKVIRTTEVVGDAGETMRQYDLLLALEDRFKDFKQPLAIRPMHHRAARRIRAHALLCLLAVTLMRHVERVTGKSWERVSTMLSTVTAVQMQQGSATWWQRSVLPEGVDDLMQAVGVRAGPERWASDAVSLSFRASEAE